MKRVLLSVLARSMGRADWAQGENSSGNESRELVTACDVFDDTQSFPASLEYAFGSVR